MLRRCYGARSAARHAKAAPFNSCAFLRRELSLSVSSYWHHHADSNREEKKRAIRVQVPLLCVHPKHVLLVMFAALFLFFLQTFVADRTSKAASLRLMGNTHIHRNRLLLSEKSCTNSKPLMNFLNRRGSGYYLSQASL